MCLHVVAGPACGAPAIGGAVPQRRVVISFEQVGRWLWPNVKLACRGCMYFLVVHVFLKCVFFCFFKDTAGSSSQREREDGTAAVENRALACTIAEVVIGALA